MNDHQHRAGSSRASFRIAIVGGGFAGLCAAQALGRAHSVSLFDPTNDFEFLPNIHELISRHTVVFGQRVLAGVSLSVLKEGILETTLARLDPPRHAQGLIGLVRRAGDGLEGLFRTFTNSPGSLQRLAGVRVL